jgi:DNA-binding CsgD family transcriptional regulator
VLTRVSTQNEDIDQWVGASALAWFTQDRHARLLIGLDAKILWWNDSAIDVLRECSSIRIRDDHLRFQNSVDQRAFDTYLIRLTAKLGTLAISLDEGCGTLLFRGHLAENTPVRAAWLEIVRDNEAFRSIYCDVDAVFGLTPAEARIVEALLHGQTVAMIAASLTVSVNTVRHHIKKIYGKIEVRSREELLDRLSPYRIV